MNPFCHHSLIALSLLTLTACGGGSGDGGDTKTPTGIQATSGLPALKKPLGKLDTSCTVTFSTDRAAPGEEILLEGELPVTIGTLEARVLAKDVSGKYHASVLFFPEKPLDAENNSHAGFFAPIHPLTPLTGGEVLIEIGDGEHSCPAVPLNIDALPAPSGNRDLLTQLMDDIEHWVHAHIRLLGADPTLADWHDDFYENGNLPPEVLMLVTAQRLVATGDDSQEVGALRQSVLSASDEELPLLLSLLEASNLPADMAADRDILESVTPPQYTFNPPAARPSPLTLMTTRSTSSGCTSGSASFNFSLDIQNTAELSYYMKIANREVMENQYQAMAQQAFSLYSTTTENAYVGAAGKVLDIISVSKTVETAFRALMPSEIHEFDVPEPTTLLVEDRDTAAFWEDATLTARGKHVGLSSLAFELSATALGALPGVVGNGATITTTVLADEVKFIQDSLNRNACVRVEPTHYGPFDVSEAEWTRTRAVPGNAITIENFSFYPIKDVGNDLLQVVLRGEQFGVEKDGYYQQFPVTVEPLVISVQGGKTVVHLTEDQIGSDIDIHAKLVRSQSGTNNSGDTTAIKATSQTPAHSISESTYNSWHKTTVHTSSNPDDYPAQIKLMPTHWPLKLHPDDYEVIVTLTLERELTLAHDNHQCLKSGQDVTVTATLEGFNDAEAQQGVSWSVSGGTKISESQQGNVVTAVFRAGGIGSLRIDATAKADSSLQDATQLAITNGNCIKKYMLPMPQFNSTGNSTHVGDCAYNTDDHEYTIDKPEDFVEPPGIPAGLWYDRQEAHNLTSTSNITHTATNENGQCVTASTSGSAIMDALYYGKSDGTFGVKGYANITGECKMLEGDRVCSGGGFMPAFIAAYYLEVSEETLVTVDGGMSCSNLSGAMLGGAVMPLIFRFANGSTAVPTGVQDVKGMEMPGGLPGLTFPVCTKGDMNPVKETQTLRIAAPGGDGTDLVVIYFMVASPMNAGAPYDNSIQPAEPITGATGMVNHASGSFDFWMRVSPK